MDVFQSAGSLDLRSELEIVVDSDHCTCVYMCIGNKGEMSLQLAIYYM